jgi:ribosomal-protein-alanine N-acetyltransferase
MNKLNLSTVPNLSSTNFNLRQLVKADANEIFILRSDERVLEFLDIKKAETIEDAHNFIDKILNKNIDSDWIYWGISKKVNSKLIGTICLWNFSEDKSIADIGFALLPESQGKGVMQEVLPIVIEFGFNEINLSCVKGEASSKNIKSIKLMEKFGFEFEKEVDNMVLYTLSAKNKRQKY